MKAAIQAIYTNPKYAKAFEWGKLITVTGGAQAIIQAIGLLSGILIVRLLPTQEYAFYTLANTMLSTMVLLSDGGISTGVMAECGKVWQDREKLGAVLVTGFALRKKFAILSTIIVCPILFYLLMHHGAPIVSGLLIIVCLIPAFFTSLSGTLLQVVPKLHQQITYLQGNQLKTAIYRLGLAIATVLIFPFAAIAILSSGLPQLWSNINLKKKSLLNVDWNQKKNLASQSEILKTVKKILPGTIYYCLSSQITIWLISFMGNTTSLAQIGALGRVIAIFSLITAVFNTLIVPRFARLSSDKYLLKKSFISSQFILVFIVILTCSILNIYSSEILFILGDKYSNLNYELFLITLGGGIEIISQNTNQLLSSRGIIIAPYIFIPIVITVQIGLIILIPLNELHGVLMFSLVSSSIIYLMRLVYFYINTMRK